MSVLISDRKENRFESKFIGKNKCHRDKTGEYLCVGGVGWK